MENLNRFDIRWSVYNRVDPVSISDEVLPYPETALKIIFDKLFSM